MNGARTCRSAAGVIQQGREALVAHRDLLLAGVDDDFALFQIAYVRDDGRVECRPRR
jgi:hypothetical protein